MDKIRKNYSLKKLPITWRHTYDSIGKGNDK